MKEKIILTLKIKIMWKALIKLIESWSYRCEHNLEKIAETEVYENEYSKIPHTRKFTYMCLKCGEIKKFKA
jgi:hypothetical protein